MKLQSMPTGIVLLTFLFIAILSSCATIPKANQALGQFVIGNPEKAWKMISRELANPTAASPEELCEMHLVTIQILQSVVHYDYAPSDPDAVAKRSYDYVRNGCQPFSKKIIAAENQYGNYFQNTRRPGLALPHYQRSLALSLPDSFEQVMNEHNIGICYGDMGIDEQRDHHRIKAIDAGERYFKKRRVYRYNADEGNEWNNYLMILRLRLDELSRKKDASRHFPEMRQLWTRIADINKRWISKQTQFAAYQYAAQLFAYAGDTAFARDLLAEGRRLSRKYPYKDPRLTDLDSQMAEAQILAAEGRHTAAAAMMTDWVERFETAVGRTLAGNDYRVAGLAQEAAGRYDPAILYLEKCIDEFEGMRKTFRINARGRVLSGLTITPYWGLIRSYAHRYLARRQEADFQGALRAARLLRGRQFGELLGLDYRVDDSLDTARLNLGPDELLINIIVTDQALVVFTIGRDRHDLHLIPIDGDIFNQTAKQAKSSILNLGCPEDFIRDIQQLSRIALQPISERVRGFKKLIVIPDGFLNGIPFALLSGTSESYAPLIADHEITVMPSISYLMEMRRSTFQYRSDRLLACADPDYGLRAVSEKKKEADVFFSRAVSELNLFAPLPETRTEAQSIASLFEPTRVKMLLGKTATESNVKSLDLEGFRYIHFATHGILGNQIPGVNEPALVLADEPGDSGQDGFLTLSEVTDLELNSEMTVLSACDTGSGRYFTGEGIMGLSRAFLLAGSKSVIVSMWPVASDATVELMCLFYRHLRSGKSKAESLRLAQLTMMGQSNRPESSLPNRGLKITGTQHIGSTGVQPFYWAPFVLIGE